MDFAQLVAKMNEIEANAEPKVIQETGQQTSEVGATHYDIGTTYYVGTRVLVRCNYLPR